MANKEVHIGDDWYLGENNDGDLIFYNSRKNEVVRAIDVITGAEDKRGSSVNNVSMLDKKLSVLSPKNQVGGKIAKPSIPDWTKYSGNPVIKNTSLVSDSIGYMAVIKASRFLASPIDNYYLYGASHDGDGIWLWTAPYPTGPWTLDSATPLFTSTDPPWVTSGTHISSPDVLWNEETSEIWIYFHGPWSGGAGQPTGLAKSSDGKTSWSFTTNPVIPLASHTNRWFGKATSYAKFIKTGDRYIAVFQANPGFDAEEYSTASSPTHIGVAVSDDGEDFTVLPEPLYTGRDGFKGPFSPGITRWGNSFLITYLDAPHDQSCFLTDDFKTHTPPKKFLTKGSTYDSDSVANLQFYRDDDLYIFYSGVNSSDESSINVATPDWSNY